MCGRFALHGGREQLLEQFALDSLPPGLAPRYNIAPSQDVLIVRAGAHPGRRRAALMRWGLVPAWSREPRTKYSMINVRAETVAEKPAFRQPFRQRRCLIPANGFFEWQETAGAKQPWYVHLRDDELLAFAGLWEHWQDRAGPGLDSCTIIVTQPNELVRRLHDRMPVILAPENYERWLDPARQDPDGLLPLLRPYPAKRMEAHRVGRAVNNPANEGPELIRAPEE
ncbi:MAG: SOS response-associated peptidase [Gammaproteobacteria bacterium]|nr:SOS response-associated peptidase [Gammaproteobacteria bacterium]NIR98870.1 SOS response-associated peptidase [Gammaproteobacteria bacterium]NIT63991.1 SOS response-associated peptidase [Gammaproteobacteria bacterium]NIV19151.1 hypothetical protein [Gammaproteobacteria bacterium]NIX10320.1 hypothetical protein [Gammaproteobacteria bacterium]